MQVPRVPTLALTALATLGGGGLLPPAALATDVTEPPLRVETVGERLPGPVGGVAVDQTGRVYVADFGDRVYAIDRHGVSSVFAAGLYGASGNALDDEGALYQASFFGNFVSRIDRDGTVATVARGLNGPVGIAVTAPAELVVCNCGGNELVRVALAAGEGTLHPFAPSDLLNCPNGITRHPADGRLFVANFSDGRVLEVTPDGESVAVLAVLPGGGNGHLTFAADGLYVTGFRANRIYRVELDGSFTSVAGTGAFGTDDGPGPEATFSTPNGIAYDAARDTLYVNDYPVPFLQRTREAPWSVVRKLVLPTLTERLAHALAEGGVDAVRASHRAFRAARPGRFTEVELNALGYRFLQQGEIDAAVAAFELNAEDYPASFNAWDSLGEGLMAAGRRDAAIAAYERSLELNPANGNAETMLERFRSESPSTP